MHGDAAGHVRVVVLGGTGFLGRAVLGRWPAHGPRPRYLVHRGDPARVRADRAAVVPVDLADDAALAASVADADVLLVLLRPDGSGWCREVVGRAVLAARAAGVQRCVHVSSIDVYAGSHAPVVDERTPPRPTSDYAREHRDVETVVHEVFGEQAVVVRLGAVFGPGGANLVDVVREAAGRRRSRLAWRRVVYGAQRMHLIRVEEAAQALVDLAAGPADRTSGVVVLTEDDRDGNDLAHVYDAVADAVGHPLPDLPVAPAGVLRAVHRVRASAPEVATRRFSGERARALGLAPGAGFDLAVRRYVGQLVDDGSDRGGSR